MKRALIVIAAVSFVAASAAAQSLSESDVTALAEQLAGTFDSTPQYNMEVEAGLTEAERHPRTRLVYRAVQAPTLGRHVLVGEEFALGTAEKRTRQRVVSLELDKAAQAIRMRQYALIDPAADARKGLTKDQVTVLEGCDVLFRQDEEVFNGAVEEKACLSPTPAGEAKEYTHLVMTVTPAQVMRAERLRYLDSGRPVDRRPDDGTPTVHFRTQ